MEPSVAIKDYWGGGGGWAQSFLFNFRGSHEDNDKKYPKKGVERAKKHSEGGQTIF